MDNPLVQPDPGLFIWTIVTFLVLLALLAKFAWRPLLAALDARQQSIRKALDDAQQATQELERLHQESAQIIRQARVEADAILNVAEETNADLIVVGNKGMTGARRFLLGSVPNNVSHHAPCSVIIVRTT